MPTPQYGLQRDRDNARVALNYAGTRRLHVDANGVAVNGTLAPTGNVTVADDSLLGIGTGNTARLSWDTTDANANALLVQLPAGGGVDVPVIAVGQSIESVDLGLYNGVVDPRIAMFGVGAVTTGPVVEFRKARGTIAAPTVVTSGDDLGTLDFYGAVAAGEYVRGASIRADMAGTIATTRGPGTLTFLTATDAAPSVLTAALTLGADQTSTFGGNLILPAGIDLTFTGTTGTNDIVLTNALADALSITDGSADIVVIDTNTSGNVITLSSLLALGSNDLTMTGTIAATGARVTQAYFTNQTTTNAETVDSSETVKHEIARYEGDALSVVRDMDVITFRHDEWLDPSGELKVGIRAESVREPLAIRMIEREDRAYPGLNMYGLLTLVTKAVQQLTEKVERLEGAAA